MANQPQPRLPGVEGGIPELEQLGFEYAAIRDQRQRLLTQEVELKRKTLDAMHRNNVLTYRYEDLDMEIIPGKEKLRVKVDKDAKKPGEDEEEDGTEE